MQAVYIDPNGVVTYEKDGRYFTAAKRIVNECCDCGSEISRTKTMCGECMASYGMTAVAR